MRNDFCVFILTHGRPDRVITVDTLKRCGYTGKVYLVIDDEDPSEPEYRARYGDQILQFSKSEIAQTFDEGDNFGTKGSPVYARNACWDLAKQVGVKYFIQLDDDYYWFGYRLANARLYGKCATIRSLDNIFESMLELFISANMTSFAMAQGGDFLGGVTGGTNRNPANSMRKCMNSFICATDRRFNFLGKLNDDVSTYVFWGSVGKLFLTTLDVSLDQKSTQQNSGGITDLYLEFGTYVKSFFTVMMHPSSTKVKVLQSDYQRLHHSIKWKTAVPKIIREQYRK